MTLAHPGVGASGTVKLAKKDAKDSKPAAAKTEAKTEKKASAPKPKKAAASVSCANERDLTEMLIVPKIGQVDHDQESTGYQEDGCKARHEEDRRQAQGKCKQASQGTHDPSSARRREGGCARAGQDQIRSRHQDQGTSCRRDQEGRTQGRGEEGCPQEGDAQEGMRIVLSRPDSSYHHVPALPDAKLPFSPGYPTIRIVGRASVSVWRRPPHSSLALRRGCHLSFPRPWISSWPPSFSCLFRRWTVGGFGVVVFPWLYGAVSLQAVRKGFSFEERGLTSNETCHLKRWQCTCV